jgi:hypothetical protein
MKTILNRCVQRNIQHLRCGLRMPMGGTGCQWWKLPCELAQSLPTNMTWWPWSPKIWSMLDWPFVCTGYDWAAPTTTRAEHGATLTYNSQQRSEISSTPPHYDGRQRTDGQILGRSLDSGALHSRDRTAPILLHPQTKPQAEDGCPAAHRWAQDIHGVLGIHEIGQYLMLWRLIKHVTLTAEADQLIWKWKASGAYTQLW